MVGDLMKKVKRQIIIVSILGIGFIAHLIFSSLPLGTRAYEHELTGTTINIPKFSMEKGKKSPTSIEFYSIRNPYALQREIEKELKNFETITCGGRIYHYNEEQDVTIIDYAVKRGFLFNSYWITFNQGKECDTPEELVDVIILVELCDCDDYIGIASDLTKYGLTSATVVIAGETIPLGDAIRENKVTYAQIIGMLDEGVETKGWHVEHYNDGGSKLYTTETYSFLKCNVIGGDYGHYIGPVGMGHLCHQMETM